MQNLKGLTRMITELLQFEFISLMGIRTIDN